MIDVDGYQHTVKLQSVLRLCSGFYRSKDPTNSIKVLKEVLKIIPCKRTLVTCTVTFLLLAHYVPNVAKRSIWDQCKKKYILRTDRPATDDLRFWKISNGHISGVVRSTSCLVLRWGFRGRRIEWRYFWFCQIQDGHLEKFKWRYLRGGSSDLLRVCF